MFSSEFSFIIWILLSLDNQNNRVGILFKSHDLQIWANQD